MINEKMDIAFMKIQDKSKKRPAEFSEEVELIKRTKADLTEKERRSNRMKIFERHRIERENLLQRQEEERQQQNILQAQIQNIPEVINLDSEPLAVINLESQPEEVINLESEPRAVINLEEQPQREIPERQQNISRKQDTGIQHSPDILLSEEVVRLREKLMTRQHKELKELERKQQKELEQAYDEGKRKEQELVEKMSKQEQILYKTMEDRYRQEVLEAERRMYEKSLIERRQEEEKRFELENRFRQQFDQTEQKREQLERKLQEEAIKSEKKRIELEDNIKRESSRFDRERMELKKKLEERLLQEKRDTEERIFQEKREEQQRKLNQEAIKRQKQRIGNYVQGYIEPRQKSSIGMETEKNLRQFRAISVFSNIPKEKSIKQENARPIFVKYPAEKAEIGTGTNVKSREAYSQVGQSLVLRNRKEPTIERIPEEINENEPNITSEIVINVNEPQEIVINKDLRELTINVDKNNERMIYIGYKINEPEKSYYTHHFVHFPKKKLKLLISMYDHIREKENVGIKMKGEQVIMLKNIYKGIEMYGIRHCKHYYGVPIPTRIGFNLTTSQMKMFVEKITELV